MTKKLLTAVSILLILGLIWFGFSSYQERNFVESIRPGVKNASLRMTNTLRYEIDDNTKITYKELFDKIESDISEIDKKILEFQSLEIPKYTKKSGPVIEYMKNCQDLLRALLQKYRKQMKYSSAVDWVDSSIAELRSSHGYGFEYAKTRADKALEDLKKTSEEVTEARNDVLLTSQKLLDFMNNYTKSMPKDAVFDPKTLSKIIERNSQKK